MAYGEGIYGEGLYGEGLYGVGGPNVPAKIWGLAVLLLKTITGSGLTLGQSTQVT